MAVGGVQDLFNLNRIPSGFSFLFFLLYCPFGAALCLLRLIFCIQLGLILTILSKDSIVRKVVLRICGTILGIVVFVKDRDKSVGCKILVSNHISEIDSLVLESVESPMLVSRASKFPAFIQWMMGYQNFANTNAELSKNLHDYYTKQESGCSALVFPEESTTNGKFSLLKFSSWPFQYNNIYQPILLTAKRLPILPINVSVIDGGFYSELLWTLFVPCTVYELRYLSKMEKDESTSAEDFAKAINKEMTVALCLQQSQYDLNDKKEFVKRMLHTQRGERQNQQRKHTQILPHQATQKSTSASKIEKMVHQVKDVFPQVPIDVIRQDIVKSKSVDATLSNILEGRVSYVPLTAEQREAEKKLQTEKKKQPTKNKADAKKSAGKGLSYEEKRRIMIEEARRRYLEKHPEYCT